MKIDTDIESIENARFLLMMNLHYTLQKKHGKSREEANEMTIEVFRSDMQELRKASEHSLKVIQEIRAVTADRQPIFPNVSSSN